MESRISYKKIRSISEIFNVTFNFIKHNFKTLYGSLFLVAGPFLLGGTMASTYFLSAGIFTSGITRRLPYSYASIIIFYMVLIACLFVGGTIYNTILNRNITVNEELQEGEKLSLIRVVRNFFNDYWLVFLNSILLLIVFFFIVIIMILIYAGVFTLFAAISPIVMGILVFFIMIGTFLILLPIISFLPIASIFVCQRDRVSVFTALSTVFGCMRNNFWNTWAMSFLALITYILLAVIVQLPVYILTLISAFSRSDTASFTSPNSPVYLVVYAICALLGYGVMSIYFLLNTFHFTSLEEKKQGTSLMENINQIV